MRQLFLSACALTALIAFAAPARAAPTDGCAALPSHDALAAALKQARQANNGGLNNDMWGVVVDRTGTTCAVAYTGADFGSQWPGSRLIAAAKAYTANAFSLDGFALSTSNLYAGAQPGGFLFGIQQNHPVNQSVAFKGPASDYGTAKDPLVGEIPGGATVFGGGLPLYNAQGKLIGGIGASGDTSCADHNVAWRARNTLKLDYVTKGASPDKNDQVIYDMHLGNSNSGFGQPTCGGTEDKVVKNLPKSEKVGAATPAAQP